MALHKKSDTSHKKGVKANRTKAKAKNKQTVNRAKKGKKNPLVNKNKKGIHGRRGFNI